MQAQTIIANLSLEITRRDRRILELEVENSKLLRSDRNDYQKLEWIHFAIQEAIKGNTGELEIALELLEDIRERYIEGVLVSKV